MQTPKRPKSRGGLFDRSVEVDIWNQPLSPRPSTTSYRKVLGMAVNVNPQKFLRSPSKEKIHIKNLASKLKEARSRLREVKNSKKSEKKDKKKNKKNRNKKNKFENEFETSPIKLRGRAPGPIFSTSGRFGPEFNSPRPSTTSPRNIRIPEKSEEEESALDARAHIRAAIRSERERQRECRRNNIEVPFDVARKSKLLFDYIGPRIDFMNLEVLADFCNSGHEKVCESHGNSISFFKDVKIEHLDCRAVFGNKDGVPEPIGRLKDPPKKRDTTVLIENNERVDDMRPDAQDYTQKAAMQRAEEILLKKELPNRHTMQQLYNATILEYEDRTTGEKKPSVRHKIPKGFNQYVVDRAGITGRKFCELVHIDDGIAFTNFSIIDKSQQFDLILSVEYCNQCSLYHQGSLCHNEIKYKKFADKVLGYLLYLCQSEGVMARVMVGAVPARVVEDRSRVGAFEVTATYCHPKFGKLNRVIFSKINSQKWPSMTDVRDCFDDFLKDGQVICYKLLNKVPSWTLEEALGVIQRPEAIRDENECFITSHEAFEIRPYGFGSNLKKIEFTYDPLRSSWNIYSEFIRDLSFTAPTCQGCFFEMLDGSFLLKDLISNMGMRSIPRLFKSALGLEKELGDIRGQFYARSRPGSDTTVDVRTFKDNQEEMSSGSDGDYPDSTNLNIHTMREWFSFYLLTDKKSFMSGEPGRKFATFTEYHQDALPNQGAWIILQDMHVADLTGYLFGMRRELDLTGKYSKNKGDTNEDVIIQQKIDDIKERGYYNQYFP